MRLYDWLKREVFSELENILLDGSLDSPMSVYLLLS